MAGELGLDVYIVSLSRAGLDDTGLSELITDLPGLSITMIAFSHFLTAKYREMYCLDGGY